MYILPNERFSSVYIQNALDNTRRNHAVHKDLQYFLFSEQSCHPLEAGVPDLPGYLRHLITQLSAKDLPSFPHNRIPNNEPTSLERTR